MVPFKRFIYHSNNIDHASVTTYIEIKFYCGRGGLDARCGNWVLRQRSQLQWYQCFF